jgi:hypothetical protein
MRVFFWQEVYFEQAKFFDPISRQEIPVHRGGIRFTTNNSSI